MNKQFNPHSQSMRIGPSFNSPGPLKSENAFVMLLTTNQKVLLVRLYNKTDPAKRKWGLPGGVVDPGDRTARAGAYREFEEEVGVPGAFKHLLKIVKAEQPVFDYQTHSRYFIFYVEEDDLVSWALKANGIDLRDKRDGRYGRFDLTNKAKALRLTMGHGFGEMDRVHLVPVKMILQNPTQLISKDGRYKFRGVFITAFQQLHQEQRGIFTYSPGGGAKAGPVSDQRIKDLEDDVEKIKQILNQALGVSI